MKKLLCLALLLVSASLRGQAIDYAYHLTSSANHLDGLPVSSSASVTSIDCTSNLATVATCLGGPVTSTGTFTITFQNQNANTVFMGPNTGAAALPSFRAPNNTDLNAWGSAHTYCRSYPVTTWTNTTETDILNCSIIGGTLSSVGQLEFVIYGKLLINDAASTVRIRVYFGATTIFDDTKGAPGAAATAGGWSIRGTFLNTGATNSQFMGGFMDWSNRVAPAGGAGFGAIAGSGSTNNIVGSFGGTSAEDSTATKTFKVTMTIATATTVSSTVYFYAMYELP